MPRMTWWRDSRGRTRALLTAFGLVALFGMLVAGFSNELFAGDQRQLVVSLRAGVTQADRETVKAGCGSLPGIGVVADRGAPDKQYRLPVRFDISGTTPAQEAALEACLFGYRDLVRGVITQGDAA